MPQIKAEPLDWMPTLGAELIQKHEERVSSKRKKAKVYRKYEYEQLPSWKEHTTSGRLLLENFDKATRYLFSVSGLVLGDLQERMFREIRVAMLRKMFKDDLVANLKYLRRHFRIDQLNDTVGIRLPRRSGKTECMAILVAIILVSQPAGNCNMYNLAGTQAKEFLQSVLKQLAWFRDSDEFGWIEVRADARQLYEIQNKKYGAINSVKSYACALKGNGKIGSRFVKGWAVVYIYI